jgi:hypothetical protein
MQLTAKRSDGCVNRLHKHTLTVKLQQEEGSAKASKGMASFSISRKIPRISLPYLFERLGIKLNPTQLNDLGRVFGNINTVLIACGSYMDDDVSVKVRRLRRHTRHDGRASMYTDMYNTVDMCSDVEIPTARGSVECC